MEGGDALTGLSGICSCVCNQPLGTEYSRPITAAADIISNEYPITAAADVISNESELINTLYWRDKDPFTKHMHSRANKLTQTPTAQLHREPTRVRSRALHIHIQSPRWTDCIECL